MSAPASLPTERRHVAELFHALSDETRLAVLEMLRGGERCVCELQDALGASQSRLSFHLKVLKQAGLVTDRREGRWAHYSLVSDTLDAAHDALRALAATEAAARRPAIPAAEAAARPPAIPAAEAAARPPATGVAGRRLVVRQC